MFQALILSTFMVFNIRVQAFVLSPFFVFYILALGIFILDILVSSLLCQAFLLQTFLVSSLLCLEFLFQTFLVFDILVSLSKQQTTMSEVVHLIFTPSAKSQFLGESFNGFPLQSVWLQRQQVVYSDIEIIQLRTTSTLAIFTKALEQDENKLFETCLEI